MDPISLEVIAASAPADRCRYLDAETATCRVMLNHKFPWAVQDHASLQLWCLAGPERWIRCVLYPKVAGLPETVR